MEDSEPDLDNLTIFGASGGDPAGGEAGFSPFPEARFNAAFLESLHARSSPKKARLKPAFEMEKESETPRLKAGAKKSPLKRAEVFF